MPEEPGEHPDDQEPDGQADELDPARHPDRRRRTARCHARDRSRGHRPSERRRSAVTALRVRESSATVGPMATPRSRRAARHRARRRRAQHRARRLAVIGIVAALALVTLILTAFGSSSPEPVATTTVAAPRRATGVAARAPGAGDGREPPDQAARRRRRRDRDRVPRRRTAARWSCSPSGARPTRACSPGSGAGSPAPRRQGPVWYQLEGGPGTEVLDVGAAPGTDVYSPVDGTVVSISRLRDRRQGARLADRRAAERRAVADRLAHPPRARPVARGRQPGARVVVQARTVVDVAAVERQALAKHARARGNNVAIDVHPAAGSLALNILFVGDVVGRPGPRGARGSARRAPRGARASTAASSTARTSPTASASPRSSPTGCSPPAPTRSRSATTPGDGRRSRPTSPTSDRVVPAREPPGRRPGPRAHRRRGARRDAGRRRQRDGLAVARARAEHVGDRRRARRRGAREDARRSSSTSMPRRRARRSRWRGGSTGG